MSVVIVKGSGDIINHRAFRDEIIKLSRNPVYFGVVVVAGGGTQTDIALTRKGFEPRRDAETGERILETPRERRIAKEVLETNASVLAREFSNFDNVWVIPSVLSFETYSNRRYSIRIFQHINGDDVVKNLLRLGAAEPYNLCYEHAFVFTVRSRVEKKQKVFKDYLDRVEIVGL